jgi:hypothetical protein
MSQPARTTTNAAPQTSVVEAVPQKSIQEGSVEPRPRVQGSDERRPRATLASLKTSPAEFQRVAPSRHTVSAGIERPLKQIEESASTSVIGAVPGFTASTPRRNDGALIPVQLVAPEGQLKVLLRDTSGGARTISVDSVSFGSRDVMGRSGTAYSNASLSSKQGVW